MRGLSGMARREALAGPDTERDQRCADAVDAAGECLKTKGETCVYEQSHDDRRGPARQDRACLDRRAYPIKFFRAEEVDP